MNGTSPLAQLDARTRLAHFRWMLLGRTLDERLAMLYRAGGIRGGSVFLGRGQEAFSAAGAMQLHPGRDVFAPLIRDSAGRLAVGETPLDVFRVCLGRATGMMRGRDGNIHRGRLAAGIWPMISHLGTTLAPMCGVLMGRRLRGQTDSIVLASIGDGGMSTGAAHEAINIAAIERLPLVLMLADNHLSYSTFSDRTYACRDLVDRAIGYGVRGHSLDGTDASACLTVMTAAVARARAGEGPQLVVAHLLRLAGHGEHDDSSYVPQELKDRYGDCLPLAERALLADGVIDAPALAALHDEAQAQVAAALAQAQGEAEPNPAEEDWSALSTRDLTRFIGAWR